MKTITSGIKNWKTTIIGIALAVLTIMQESTDLSKIEDWIFPALITALGILMRDADKSSEGSGIKMLMITAVCMCLISCTPTGYIVDTTTYGAAIATKPEAVIITPEHVTEVGGFQNSFDFKGSILTDHGAVDIGNGGITVDAVVVDLRSGK